MAPRIHNGEVLKETFAEIVDATVKACRAVYGDNLQGVVVFGSVALRRMTPESDVDVLVVAESLPDGRLKRMEEFGHVEERVRPSLERARGREVHTRLSPLVYTLEELGYTGFLLFDIACDGVVRFDRDGRLAAYLADVRERLRRRGAERRSLRGSRYWVLDPDVTPGKVVEL